MTQTYEYTDELAKEICEAISTTTEPLDVIILANPHFPPEKTIRKWRLYRDDFGNMYIRAKQMQAELLAEEILEIADDGRNDWMERLGKDGQPIGWQLNGEHVHRSRVRIDTRKWLASKLAQKIYGDKPPEADKEPASRADIQKLQDNMSALIKKNEKDC